MISQAAFGFRGAEFLLLTVLVDSVYANSTDRRMLIRA